MKLRLMAMVMALATGLATCSPERSQSDQALDAYVRSDFATAYRLSRPLAEQGDASAQYTLGLMHANGQGVAQDDTAAVGWYRKAADQGYADAQNNLGVMYKKGQGVAQDHAAAVGWYRKAAEQGQALAQHNLGVMYENGEGGAQDYVQAHKWFNLGAVSGDAEAVKGRDIVAAKMTPAQIAEAQRLARAATQALADPCKAIPDYGPMPRNLAPGRAFSGPVVYIGDGDSLCVATGRPQGNWVEVRLADFYAPELSAPGGREAKAALERIAMGQRVKCVAQHRSYDRVVAVCTVQGVSLGQRMRAAGVIEGGSGRP